MKKYLLKNVMLCSMLLLSLTGFSQSVFQTSVTSTKVTCPDGDDGTATIAVSGGVPPYSYSWNTTPTQSSATASGLAAGSYMVYISDGGGNTGSFVATVTQPGPVKLKKVYTNVTCYGANDGTATVTVISGGTPPYTYSWLTSPPQLGQTATGLAPGKPKVITTDANGCTGKWTFKIDEPNEITTSTTSNNVSCSGASDGGATVNVFGGSSPYSYSWSSGETTNSISGKPAGTYVLTITDDHGCIKTKTVVLTQPKVISTSTQTQQITCKGYSNGGAVVTVSGGTKPYSYTWNSIPAQYSNVLSNVGAGTYTLTIVDANGCMKQKTVVITEPSSIVEVTAIPTNINCAGALTGSAAANAIGGSAPYIYSWSNGMTGNTISGLAAGSYSVVAFDSKGCAANAATIVIEEPAAMTISKTMEGPTCYGASNGWICANANGGTGVLSYLWNNGATSSCLQGIPAGTYSVTVSDENGCSQQANFMLSNPVELAASVQASPITCYASSNGSVTASAIGGTGSYSYSWSNGATGATITGLSSGTYTVTVSDMNGCSSTGSASLTEPDEVTIMETVNEITCYNSSNGSICVDAFGGTGSFTYSWNTGATGTQCLLNLSGGSYSVVATDANGCQATYAHEMFNPSAVSVTASSTPITCNGAENGTISAIATGGIGSYNFSWNINGGYDAQLNGLGAGVYTIYVTDENGCGASASTEVTAPTAISINKTMDSPKCYNGADGYACATANGGTGSLTYSWNTGATTSCLQGVAAGSYTVLVTDENGCTAEENFILSNPAELAATAQSSNVTCFGAANATASATAMGGSGAYSFSWNNGATTASINGLIGGTFIVTVSDANGCSAMSSATITEPTALQVSAASTNASCGNANNGTATATANGGSGNYSYLWNNGATTAIITGLSAGTYSVTVTDLNGNCTKTASTIVIGGSSLTISKTILSPKCYNGNDGSMCVTVSGGTGALTYSWNVAGNSNCINNKAAGTYTVTVTDAAGCSVTTSGTLVNPAQLVATTSSVNISCNNANNGSANVVASGGTSPYTYTWSNGVKAASISGLCAGTYTVTVRDAKGCTATGSVTITNPSSISVIKTMANPKCKNGTDGWICAAATGGTGTLTYTWNTGATTSCIYGLAAGYYTVVIKDSKGCSVSQTICLSNPNPIVITKNVCNVTYCNGSNGSICVNASGGTGALTYSWSTGATTNCISCLRAGTYKVFVKDSKGCTSTMTITVNQPSWCGGCREAVFGETSEEEAITISANALKFDAYPNPFVVSSRIEFTAAEDALVNVELFNVKGEFVKSIFSGNVRGHEKNQIQLDGSELAQGVYLCKLSTETETKFIKLILQK